MSRRATAPNACLLCSAQKKSCDRLMPVCGRCTRHLIGINYLESAAAEASHRRHATYLRACQDLDSSLTSALLEALEVLNIDAERLIDGYMLSIHSWLPMIHPVTLRKKAESLHRMPCAEIACLLLHILLVQPLVPGSLPSLYNDCKSSFMSLQMSRRDRLATLQSGLLLAIFEQGQGLASSAYTTLAICASLGYVMGLHQSLDCATAAREERCRVWWATYFLDRLDLCSTEGIGRVPLVHDAQLGDTLPGDDELWSHCPGPTASYSPTACTVSSDEGGSLGGFAGELQAMFTLQCVQSLAKNASDTSTALLDDGFWRLDMSIQRETYNLFNKAHKQLHHEYNAIVILLLWVTPPRGACARGS
ncbi:hypothetical protein F5883DRAFT_509596 [Diaporthe sp. PMI_573]|nr:hypothetical protein F5883DRAFT_509596 [Diaporthaceae sp. PMI_573]